MIRAEFEPEKDSARAILDRQYVTDQEHLAFDRHLDSVLLPLRLQGIRISEQFGFPKGAGAITAVYNSIVILDRLGNLYGWQPGHPVKNLEYPPLPNHVLDYLQSAAEPQINDRRFRAYHVVFVPSLCSLAVSHEAFDTSVQKSRISVSLIPIDTKTLKPTGDWKVIFVGDPEPTGPNEQGGGGLAVRDPYELYLGIGDYDQTDRHNDWAPPQDPRSTFGKIIEVDLRTGDHKIVSSGHRNPEGLAVLEDGRLDSTEQGPYGGDELNEIREGENYGWPNVTLGTAYGAYTWNDHSVVGSHADYAQPAYAWLPSIGVSSLLQVKHFGKAWDGDLLVASLKSQSLFRLRDHAYVEYAEPIFVGQRIRDLAELERGDIALWTDDAQLAILTVDATRLVSDTRNHRHKEDEIQHECLYCHHFGPTSPSDFAPTLTGLFERKIASDNFRYSPGLRTQNGVWTEDKLRIFLSDPGKFAPGTGMPSRDLSKQQIEEVIRELESENPRRGQ